MKVKVIDPRTKKEYIGDLRTGIQIGSTAVIALVDGKTEFHISKVQGWLHGSSNKYYIVDAHGVRFTVIFQ